jgi:serine/threonine protein kinase
VSTTNVPLRPEASPAKKQKLNGFDLDTYKQIVGKKQVEFIQSPLMCYSVDSFLKSTEESFVALVVPSSLLSVLKFSTQDTAEEKEEKRILDLLREGDCRNILYYLDHQFTPRGYYFVFPYIQQAPFPATFPVIWKFLFKVVNAVACCHANNVVHCDIKPDNFLISEEDVFLCDFGCAQIERSDTPMMYGTLPYWSPEVCDNQETANDFPRDLWALGVTIIELVYHQYPFSFELPAHYIGGDLDRGRAEALSNSAKRYLALTTDGSPFPSLLLQPETENKRLHAILQGLLVWEPKKRLSAKDTNVIIEKWCPQDEQ